MAGSRIFKDGQKSAGLNTVKAFAQDLAFVWTGRKLKLNDILDQYPPRA